MPAPLPLLLAALLGAGTPAATDPRSVYRIAPLGDGAAIAVSSIALVLPWLLEDRLIDLRCPCDRREVPRWERFAIGLRSPAADAASTLSAGLAVLLPPAADLFVLGRGGAWLEDAVVFAEALAVNGAIVTGVKYAVQRPIPRAYAGDPRYLREPGAYRAFYSGHAATTFTALTAAAWTIRLRWGERIWPWIVAAAGGASVAIERVAAGHHFPSDVLVGAAAGVAIGTAVPLLHRRRAPARRLALVPAGPGLALAGTF
jgi:membrane-associated phospholipid phosphatase